MSRDIAGFKGIFRGAGGSFSGLVRQPDIIETELNQVETKINSAEVRHRSGATSSGEYKKVLAGCQRRKEKAELVIAGTLLRLRKETRY